MPAKFNIFRSSHPSPGRRAGGLTLPILAATSLLVLVAGSGIAAAQDARRATERPRDEQQVSADRERVSRAAGDLLARTVLRRSRNLINSTTDDYRLAALGLRLARRTAPDDAELIRREIEAWTAADDTPRLIEATRELIRLDPRDTIAQLRLIDTQIGRLNTVEERRAAYDRLLGPAGRGLRAPIRSRLALDAALLAREDGDEEAFLRLLTESTLLDSTNKNAAALYASMLLRYADTALERFELIANVLQTDPLDIGAYENAAIELMSSGAYAGAQRYLDRMRDLLSANGQDFMSRSFLTDPRLYQENRVNDYLITTWHTSGSGDVLSFIADAQGYIESRFSAEVRAMRERGFTEAQMLQAIGQRDFPFLPHQLELFRLLALVSQPEEEARSMAFTQRPIRRDEFLSDLNPYELEGYIEPPTPTDEDRQRLRLQYPQADEALIQRLAEQNAKQSREVNTVHEAATRFLLSIRSLQRQVEESEGIDQRTKQIFGINLTLESVWMLLAAEISVDLAEDRFENLLEQLSDDALEPEAVQRYRGWVACNRGDFETARELLTPLAEGDASAIYALGMTELRSGNTDRAVELFDRLRFEFPQTVLACVASDRIEQVTGHKPFTPASVRELNDYALSFAPWIERVTRSPREFMALSVRPTAPTIGPLDRVELVLRLTNTSGRALAVGPASPINSRFLFTPRIEIEGQPYTRLIRDLLTEQIRRELDLRPDAPLPPEIAARVEQLIDERVLSAGRRLLEVVDADRVLRLEPNETLVIPVWAGRGNAGELIDRDLTERVTVQWSIAQGFRQTSRPLAGDDAAPGFVAGPMSMTTGTDRQIRLKLPDVSYAVLAERIRQGEGTELAHTLLHATSLLSRAGIFGEEEATEPEAGDAGVLRSAILDRADALSDAHLALLLLRLSEIGVLNSDDGLRRDLRTTVTDRFVDGSSGESVDGQLLLAASIVSLTRAADEPLLRIAQESADPHIAEFARVLAAILDERGFATDPDQMDTDPALEPDEPAFGIDEDMLQTPQGK